MDIGRVMEKKLISINIMGFIVIVLDIIFCLFGSMNLVTFILIILSITKIEITYK